MRWLIGPMKVSSTSLILGVFSNQAIFSVIFDLTEFPPTDLIA